MKLGTNEPKKVIALGVLGLVAAYVLLAPDDSGPSAPSSAPRPAARAPELLKDFVPGPETAPRRSPNVRRNPNVVHEFRPSLKPKRPEERPDPLAVDPTLRLAQLAKVQNIGVDGGRRSLFDFSAPPAPKLPEPKIVPGPVRKFVGPVAPPEPVVVAEAPKPPPPPITLRYYGFTSPAKSGARRAFFLDGEDILVAGEGDTLKRRYRIVRISGSSAVVEDTEHKHQQTLPLVPEMQS
ncbi:MAG: hypothetical protein SFV54_26275 [Bryobacteraceae bacterium]|nr:hypothetical protein [Bryobacteraceae bacterium]